MRVALVVMPMASLERPSLAAGLLQAALARRGIDCVTHYFNLMLGRMLDANSYSHLSNALSSLVLAGEWAFSQAFYGSLFSDREAYAREVLDERCAFIAPEYRDAIWRLQELAPDFLRLAFESRDWSQYELVGFTSSFSQTMPSLCLARMIRERHPRVKLAMGGANMEAGMGRQYIEHYGFLDFVSTGEADDSFPQLCENLRDGRHEIPPGFLYREAGRVRQSPPSTRPVQPDALPTPDYGDYFRSLEELPKDPLFKPLLPVEASRGCWWGEHSHCTFCGLNGETMAFRKKDWRRVVEETDALTARHGPLTFQFTDNILAMDYFAELLPLWAAREQKVPKFFEIKSNLKWRHVRLLKEAGVTSVQAGVESLSDGTLRVMRKGVSGAHNVALLRWCQEQGLQLYWNLIYGFPREEFADYERTASLLAKLTHLPPPGFCGEIRMDRFSPNHGQWKEQGFTRIEPAPAYRHIFPFSEASLRELAYYFVYDHPQHDEVHQRGEQLVRFCQLWRERAERGECGELVVKPHPEGGFVLVDSRFGFERSTRILDERELALLLACDGPTSRQSALDACGRRGLTDLAPALERLIEQGVIAAVGKSLVTLALLPVELRAEEA
jgi:ribosomal peptide maturation radical SAM protein 1